MSKKLLQRKNLNKKRTYRLNRILVFLFMVFLLIACNNEKLTYVFHKDMYTPHEATIQQTGYDSMLGMFPIIEVSFTDNQHQTQTLEGLYLSPFLYGYHQAHMNWKPVQDAFSFLKQKLIGQSQTTSSNKSTDNETFVSDTSTILIAVDNQTQSSFIYLLPFFSCIINIISILIMCLCLFPCGKLLQKTINTSVETKTENKR